MPGFLPGHEKGWTESKQSNLCFMFSKQNSWPSALLHFHPLSPWKQSRLLCLSICVFIASLADTRILLSRFRCGRTPWWRCAGEDAWVGTRVCAVVTGGTVDWGVGAWDLPGTVAGASAPSSHWGLVHSPWGDPPPKWKSSTPSNPFRKTAQS